MNLSTMALATIYMHMQQSGPSDEGFHKAVGEELVNRKVLTITPIGSKWHFAELDKQGDLYWYLETLRDRPWDLFVPDAVRYLKSKKPTDPRLIIFGEDTEVL